MTVLVGDSIPAELRERPQWLVWRYEQRDGASTKVPYQARALAQRARADDPSTWCSYEEAVAKMTAANSTERRGVKPVDGVGFVPTEDDPFSVIDLDGCVVDGELVTEAQQIIDTLATYWEVSPSGTGVRLVAYGSLPTDAGHVGTAPWAGRVPHAKAQIEAYDHGHYFAMTGNGDGQIADRQQALDTFADTYLGKRNESAAELDWTREPEPSDGFAGTDDELIDALTTDDPSSAALWRGETIPADKDGDSDQDFALCCRLAELTGPDPQRILRLWGKSALGQRDKYQRDSYSRATVERAIAKVCGESVGRVEEAMDPPEPSTAELGPRAKHGRTAAELLASTPEEPDWLIPGVAARGQMTKFAAREKTGKGTLITNLLGCLERGEATVFGPATAQTTALIYTEEPTDSIREKIERAGLVRAFVVYGYELAQYDWSAKVQWLVAAAVEGGDGVIFVDNISRATGVTSESDVELARAVEPLGEHAAAAGITVFLDHHHRKASGPTEDKSRGGTALAGACDNNIEIERVGGWESRTRKLSSRGRMSAMIWERTIELSADGRRYEEVAGIDDPQRGEDRYRLDVLRESDSGVTVADFAAQIGRHPETARKALRELVAQGRARKLVGQGNQPDRYIAEEAPDEPAI